MEEVHNGVVSFFQELLATKDMNFLEDALSLLVLVITDMENEALIARLSMEEVKVALWSIPLDGCPGPDGFLAISLFLLGIL